MNVALVMKEVVVAIGNSVAVAMEYLGRGVRGNWWN